MSDFKANAANSISARAGLKGPTYKGRKGKGCGIRREKGREGEERRREEKEWTGRREGKGRLSR